jgi:hypothetical protein
MPISEGDFATALTRADELIAVTGERDQLHNAARMLRALVLSVRGDFDEALPEAAKAVERAREVADTQQLSPALITRALGLVFAGHEKEAHRVVDELLEVRDLTRSMMLEVLPLVFEELGRGSDYADAVARSPASGPWFDAGLALVGGRPLEAARVYEKIGARFVEAWARLLAAERGDVSQLEAAHAYFTEQGAAPFLRRCEAVLAASA